MEEERNGKGCQEQESDDEEEEEENGQADNWKDLRAKEMAAKASLDCEEQEFLYLCELRRMRQRKVFACYKKENGVGMEQEGEEQEGEELEEDGNSGDAVSKSICFSHMKHAVSKLDAYTCPYWNTYHDGVFVGGRGGGKGVHIDQVFWMVLSISLHLFIVSPIFSHYGQKL